jgi:MacB-like periplasmic core domain
MRPEHWLYTIPLRLRSLFRWAQADQELDYELRDHLERKTEKYVAQGMTQEEAHRRARIDLGGIEQTKEKCRDARRVNWIQDLVRDIRYALRGFRRAPLFVVSVVATIALGLGIDTALFTVFNAYYFRPVDVRDPRSSYNVEWRDRAGSVREFSWPEYQQFLKENPSFSEAIAYQPTEALMNDRHAFGLLVTGDYFRVLGVDAALGRTLLPEDASVPGREAVVVLSAVAWQTRFGADPEIVGKKITLRGYPFRVVGVANPGFRGLGARPTDLWAPLTVSALLQTRPDLFGPDIPRTVSIVGRLRPGHSLSQCRASVSVWMERATANAPQPERASQAILQSQATYKPWKASNLLTFTPILIAFSLV